MEICSVVRLLDFVAKCYFVSNDDSSAESTIFHSPDCDHRKSSPTIHFSVQRPAHEARSRVICLILCFCSRP